MKLKEKMRKDKANKCKRQKKTKNLKVTELEPQTMNEEDSVSWKVYPATAESEIICVFLSTAVM